MSCWLLITFLVRLSMASGDFFSRFLKRIFFFLGLQLLVLISMYEVTSIRFQTFFVQAFKIVVDYWKFSILLLYILWDYWLIFMISGLNEQLQQELKYILLKPDCHSWWISKIQSGREDTLKERYAITFCFKLGKDYLRWKLDLLLWPRDQETVFPVEACWLSRTQVGQTEQIHPQTFDDPFIDSTGVIYMPWVPTGQTVNKEYYVEILMEFRKRFDRKKPTRFKSSQWHFHQDNTPGHKSILVTDYLTKIGIKTVHQHPYSSVLAPYDFWLFPKLRGCRYETTEEIKEVVTKVIETITQRTSMEPSRSCWKCTSALQPEEITSKGTRVSCVYYQ